MKYRITYWYRTSVTVDVDAPDEESALAEADEALKGELLEEANEQIIANKFEDIEPDIEEIN